MPTRPIVPETSGLQNQNPTELDFSERLLLFCVSAETFPHFYRLFLSDPERELGLDEGAGCERAAGAAADGAGAADWCEGAAL